MENVLLVCLGNIGPDYENSRHNAGFLFGENFIKYLATLGYQHETKENKKYTLTYIKEKRLFFLFPKTLMNLSGTALKHFLAYTEKTFKIIVVHDDLDIPIGQYKINLGKGPKTHNGVLSIEEALQTKDFERIRIGIENRNGLQISGLDYVLEKFSEEERKQIIDCFPLIIKEILPE